MKSPRSIPALGAFFVAIALVISACGGSGVPADSAAVVAGNPISVRAVNHWMYVLAKTQSAQSPGQPVIVPNDPPAFTKCIAQVKAEIPTLAKTADKTLKSDCGRVFASLSGTVLDYLIKAYWYQATAHRLGIKVTDAQVQKALDAVKKSLALSTKAQFQSFLTSTGQTLADVTYRVKIEQIYNKLLARHPTKVTAVQIAAYYNAHKSQFGTPETRNMRIVLAKSADQANAAKTALRHGASWNVVAKQYSIDPTTKDKGGQLTDVTAGQQDAALSKAAFAASVNKLLGPVKGQFGYYVLDVTKITPATQRSLAQSTALIRQTLNSQAQTTAANAVTSEAKKDWQAKTTCRTLYRIADCAGAK
jgi:foldase protein PrsA